MKKRRKPAYGGKAAGTVAGSLRESGRGALVDGRRLGSGKPLALTRGRWKRLWRSAEAWRQVEAGRDRGRQRPDRRPRARLRTPRRGSAAHLRTLATSSRMTKGADDSVRSWRRAVKRRSTWGWIAARWSGAALRMALGLTPQHIAETVIVARAAGLGVERISGARIECRLQTSVRRIFPTRSR